MDDDMPMMTCPNCGHESEDFDGFGVLACQVCGWCSHPNSTNGVCGFCGKLIRPEESERYRI